MRLLVTLLSVAIFTPHSCVVNDLHFSHTFYPLSETEVRAEFTELPQLHDALSSCVTYCTVFKENRSEGLDLFGAKHPLHELN